ncbi:MAG: hypothetical protein CEN88_400 [Candidatus Berkelbacteria bacterium Licking1014_2]|uniref:ATP-grasp domain-containing protein n=1 Tax=Candidatus Berkelbacteria bacterium Licking1014_2 TaxID=2017146 RepID=A0A554LT24_9BACT|nr:MAG: hypothetical protein CEN88_400 [Candidatus Berkelbacteria bacterium Licking1014_2]
MTKKKPFVGQILEQLAEKAGVQIKIEPRYGYVGQITTSGGKKRYFRNTNFDLNPLGATEVARDKDYASYFMKLMGYPVIPGRTFYSDRRCRAIRSQKDIHAAYRYAYKLGFPVIVKPNSRSQGNCVSKVYNKRDFYQAARQALRKDAVIIVQRFIPGKDFRIVVLDGRLISAYQRLPLVVVGDGQSTIYQLLKEKQRQFIASGRETKIDMKDFRLQVRLRREKITLKSVLPTGKSIHLLDNANLSDGGESIDVTQTIHPDWQKIAVDLTADMGLRYCGVDLLIEGEIDQPLRRGQKYWIIEINAAPGIDNYAAGGQEQEDIVLAMYLQVLKAIDNLP